MGDGSRSTIFEYDLQLFFVTFYVSGTQLQGIEIYSPYMGATMSSQELVAVRGPNNSTGLPTTEFKSLAGLLSAMPGAHISWTRRYEQFLIDAFIEKYTPKATIRRMS